MKRLLVALMLCLYTQIVYAVDCAVPSSVTTPCRGVLLPTPAATEGLLCLEHTLPSCKLTLEQSAKTFTVRIESLHETIRLKDEHTTRLNQLLDRATVIEPTPFWREPLFISSTSFIAGVALTVAIVYGVKSIN